MVGWSSSEYYCWSGNRIDHRLLLWRICYKNNDDIYPRTRILQVHSIIEARDNRRFEEEAPSEGSFNKNQHVWGFVSSPPRSTVRRDNQTQRWRLHCPGTLLMEGREIERKNRRRRQFPFHFTSRGEYLASHGERGVRGGSELIRRLICIWQFQPSAGDQ